MGIFSPKSGEWRENDYWARPRKCKAPTHRTRNTHRVLATGDSLLIGIQQEVAIVTAAVSLEVCCLPRGCIHCVAERLLSFPTHSFYSKQDWIMLEWSYPEISKDFKSLRTVPFRLSSPTLPAREGDLRKRRWIEQVNGCLNSWCHAQSLSLCDVCTPLGNWIYLQLVELKCRNCEQECSGQ